MKKVLLFVILLPWLAVNAQSSKMRPIFNGKNLNGWTTFLKTQGLNKDPQKVFTIEDEAIHVTGQDFGYIATTKTYQDFHLSIEFKWGEKKFPPRVNEKRDGGILFHASANDKVWPKSLECQIQEGDVGDLWLIDSATAVVAGKRTTPKNYMQVIKNKDAERPHGEWNRVEVLSKNGKFTYTVNGVVVNEGESPSITRGRILLQSEGAELYYRKVLIEEL